jgi:hypothetical protein
MSAKKTTSVMEESQSEQNAVSEVLGNKSFHFHKHLVIAYCDEESLRELMATPSSFGIGFSFREAAVAVIPSGSSRDIDSTNISKNIRKKPAFRRDDDHRGSQSRGQRLRQLFGLTDTRRIVCATLQNAVIAGVLMFYSRSVVGALIRACAGA